MKTKASVAFGAYGTRPTDLHGDWYRVSLHARLIGMELIALCADPGDLRLPVGDDWRETLCAKMCVSGPDRRNAKVAMSKLEEAGFLRIESGFARVSLVPLRVQSGSTSVSLRSHSGFTPDPKTTQTTEIVQDQNAGREVNKEGSEDLARAREASEVQRRNPKALESFIPVRRPVGEAPPNVQAPAPALPVRLVWELYCSLVLNRLPVAAGEPDWPSIRTIAAAVAEEGGDSTSGQERAARRLLLAWKADKRSSSTNLANLAKFLFQYTKPLPGPTVLKPAPVPRAAAPESDRPELAFTEMANFGMEVLANLHAKRAAKVSAQ